MVEYTRINEKKLMHILFPFKVEEIINSEEH